jgi:hypothetical protein
MENSVQGKENCRQFEVVRPLWTVQSPGLVPPLIRDYIYIYMLYSVKDRTET